MTPSLVATDHHDDGVDAWRAARFAPSAALTDAITGFSDYWERTGSFTCRRQLPHAEGVLIVNLGDPIVVTGGDGGVVRLRPGEAFAAGPHLRPALSRSAGEQAGIHVFLPLPTLRRLLGVPLDRLLDRTIALDDVLGPGARELTDRLTDTPDASTRIALLDAALARRLAAAPALSGEVRHAVGLLRHRPDTDIAGIARHVGWSRKHLTDRVRDAVGVGPRSFRRLLRFQALTGLIDARTTPPDWAGLAVDAGYYDQSHMIREFREFAGLTPGEMLARALPFSLGMVEA